MPGSAPPVDTPPTADGPRATLRLALWFGLVAGLGEIALLGLRKYLLHRFLIMSKEAVWMAPLADVVLFVLAGILLIGVRAGLPSRFRPPPVLVFAALAVFTLLLMYQPLYRPAAALLALGVGTVAFRMTRRWGSAFDKLIRWTFPAMIIVILLATAVIHVRAALEEGRNRPGTTARSGAPDILFIVLDTVRSWNLSVYGYARPTTPEIARWMRDGLRFDHALSTASWTLPSHASMFTGRFPHELLADWLTPLDARYPTLAEVLSARGYATAGFVANTLYCSYESGLARGFGHYRDYPITVPQIILTSSLGRELAGARVVRRKLLRQSAEDINGEFLDWLKDRQDTRPYFAFLNYLDAHDPYQPPAPFDTLFSAPGAAALVERLDNSSATAKRTPEAHQAAIDKYDESIAYLDQQLGRLFSELKRRGNWDNTLVVIVSDHGEEFGERGVYYHGNSLYRASLEVPLLLRFPGVVPPGRFVAEPVSLKDLAATVLDLAGAGGGLPGKSLARHWDGSPADGAAKGDALLMELNYAPRLPKDAPIAKGPMKSVLRDNLRLIRNGDGREELFDFAADLTERTDLAGAPERQSDLQMLREALQALATAHSAPAALSAR